MVSPWTWLRWPNQAFGVAAQPASVQELMGAAFPLSEEGKGACVTA